MKKIIVLIGCTFGIILGVQAQIQKTPIKQKAAPISGFGGVLIETSQIAGKSATLIGGGAGIRIHQVYLGGYGLGLSSDILQQVNNQRLRLTFGHGGFWLKTDILSRKLVHFTLDAKVGWGSVNFVQNDGTNVYKVPLLVANPAIGLNLNLSRFIKISGIVGHRFTSLDEDPAFSTIDLNTFNYSLSLKFGWW